MCPREMQCWKSINLNYKLLYEIYFTMINISGEYYRCSLNYMESEFEIN